MADGIEIRDAAVEIGAEELAALVRNEGGSVTVTRLDVAISTGAIAALLAQLAPAGAAAPTAEVGAGELRVSAERDGKPVGLNLRMAGLTLRFEADGVRLCSDEA
jgi:hypothetical protein